jgi:hypothetical protein
MPTDAQHFVIFGPVLNIAVLEAIKQHVCRNRTLLFIVWYDPQFKGDSSLAQLASDLAACDVLFRPTPPYVPIEALSEYGDGRSRPFVPWASASDMLRAWTLAKSGADAEPRLRP